MTKFDRNNAKIDGVSSKTDTGIPVKETKQFAIGIDLHGTLLNEEWIIPTGILSELVSILARIHSRCPVYICTGNDLSFTESVLPEKIREIVDGYVLENGCVYYGEKKEELLITPEERILIKALEAELKEKSLPDLLFYGNRTGTISLFTKDKGRGVSPYELSCYLKNHLKGHSTFNRFTITHSDVAVDILPAGHSKYSGMQKICPNRKIIAVADSCNDWEFLFRAEQRFIPNNSSPLIEDQFRAEGIEILPLRSYSHQKDIETVYQSSRKFTYGVVEILKILERELIKKRGSL
jgi:hydroxymethylpyrimidine pyrophosphatase-like HAD family hydrolase